MNVGNAMVVGIHYTLKNKNGEVLEDTSSCDPFIYIHGANNIVSGLEDALETLVVDDDFDIEIPPEKGFGFYTDKLIAEVPKGNFPPEISLEAGQKFMSNGPKGPRSIVIKEVKTDTVLVDGNHELAGETLYYKGKVMSIREATPDELDRGQISSPCCSGGKCSSEK